MIYEVVYEMNGQVNVVTLEKMDISTIFDLLRYLAKNNIPFLLEGIESEVLVH